MIWAGLELPNATFLHADFSVRRCFEAAAVQKGNKNKPLAGRDFHWGIVLVWKRSGNAAKLLAAGALGGVLAFWLHRDLFYLLTH